jgi:predicted MFS family arabinose efflux permease
MKDNFSDGPPEASLRILALRVALGGAVTLACAMGIGRFVYTPILPFMTEALHLSGSQAGLIASANFLGYLLGAMAVSIRLPGTPRQWLVFGLLLSAATTAGVGAYSSVAAIAVLRCLGGIASAICLVFASSLVLETLARAQRRGWLAVHFAGVGAGIAGCALMVLAATKLGIGWRGMWFAHGALTLLGAAVVAALIAAPPPSPDAAADENTAASVAGLGSQGGLIRLILAYGLFGFGYVITATFLVAIMRGTAELKPYEPMAWLAVGIAGVPSVALWLRAARRIGFERGYALACAFEAIGVLCSLLPNLLGILAAAILVGGTFVGITALGFEAARARAPANPRRVLGLMTVAFSIGQIVGPTVAGTMRDLTGSFAEASILAAIALAAAALLTVPSRI